MSVETLQNHPILKQYDVLITPDPGGRHEPDFSLADTEVIAKPIERILPPVESGTTFSSSGSINFQSDFERIDNLHIILGMRGKQRLAHDCAFERARYERAITDEEKQAVKKGVRVNMERTLYERAHSTQSTIVYYQDEEGRIYHPDFPGESFDRMLQRGVENSKRQGFVDCEREVKEFEGWKEVMGVLFNPQTPIGTKEIVISGPGLKQGTAFTDNFVDIFTKAVDPATGKAVVAMTRFASGASYHEYRQIAGRLNANYFAGGKTEDAEIDIFFKEHPILIGSNDLRDAAQLFNEEFCQQKGALEEEKTRGYLGQCRLFILHYAETICAGFFDPEQVKLAFNATINKFDEVRKGLIERANSTGIQILEPVRGLRERVVSFIDQVNYYGRRQVEEMMVGCGLSAGFSTGKLKGFWGKFTGLISGMIGGIGGLVGLGESDSMGSLYFPCPACGAINKRPREGYVERCQNPDCISPEAVCC
ncbi:hypothetical protein HYU96_04425 [Candidatus Daviesbacteria bacterium]|nr:hypothetical protein [Candidatus Daviesbacteria bacterium]